MAGVDPKLCRLVEHISDSAARISRLLHDGVEDEYTGDVNPHGDPQIAADVQCDDLILRCLAESGVVSVALSEERPELERPGGEGFSVAYDPLDGSSIFGANFTVGSIFGIWRGEGFEGKTGRDQAAACYALYGPRTQLVLARPAGAGSEPSTSGFVVQEFVLTREGHWVVSRDTLGVARERKVFAPANMRAAGDNQEYRELLNSWISQRYTLRYSGGMVSDVHHILSKGGGVFCNPESPSSPAKLRLLFECAPLSYIMEAAGGASISGEGDLLDLPVGDINARTTICLGSKGEVEMCRPAMRGGS